MKNNFLQILENKGFKDKFIKKVNDNINIPILNEATEEKIYTALYDIIVNLLLEIFSD